MHIGKAALMAAVIALATLAPRASLESAHAEEMSALGAQGLTDAEVRVIKETINAWTDALVHGDMSRWDKYWAEDAVLMPPGSARITGDAKRNALAASPPYDDIGSATFSDWDVVGRDDLAVVTNNITIEAESGREPSTSKQLIIMRRHADGKWLVQAVIFNSAG